MKIKFRGLSKEGKMVYGDLQNVSDEMYIKTDSEMVCIKPESYGQYLMFNDKDGNEVYSNSHLRIPKEVLETSFANSLAGELMIKLNLDAFDVELENHSLILGCLIKTYLVKDNKRLTEFDYHNLTTDKEDEKCTEEDKEKDPSLLDIYYQTSTSIPWVQYISKFSTVTK